MIGIVSPGIARIPFLEALVGEEVLRVRPGWAAAPAALSAVAGWGRRPSSEQARRYAARAGLPFVTLEDGFLRSYGTGERFPPLSMVLDRTGIYFDSTAPSALEQMLASGDDLLAGIVDDVARARQLILAHGLSKYNHAPPLDAALLRAGDSRRVLVIDQTAGDKSVALGAASGATFEAMLAAARAEHPGATIYVKTHPEVSAGRKGGYLTGVQDDASTVVLRQPVNPLSLIGQMDHVYVVTSTMGFEALLAGKPVSVFGLPWYAGWGASVDRQHCPRRGRPRSVDELFAAAYFHYSHYLDPVTRQGGTIFDVIDWLSRQREQAARFPGRIIGVGFRRWKAANVRPLLSLNHRQVHFVADAPQASKKIVTAQDALIFWGRNPPPGIAQLAASTGARLVRMEDGFVRSVGLGSDLIRPLSLVLDMSGIYFDPTISSDLEHLLSTTHFNKEEISRAKHLRNFMVQHGITKYNLERRAEATWPSAGKQVVFVPGQVEDDASIRYGCTGVNTNLGLLAAARAAHPQAYIVYKPHPDVMAGNRLGKVAFAAAQQIADHVETTLSVVSCIDACDVVHTMTSLTGFDALLRGKRVVVYGQPFYAGWGLTEDVVTDGVALSRRQRQLSIDELVAATLLRYPTYWDWELMGYTTCEAVLHRVLATRTALEANGGLDRLRAGWMRRQWRKAVVLARAQWQERSA